MEEDNVIYVIKPLNGDEILSINPPGIAADNFGNLMARIDGFIFVETAAVEYDFETKEYTTLEPAKVHFGNMVAITGNFVDYQYTFEQFIAAARCGYLTCLNEDDAKAVVEFLKKNL